MNEPTQEQSTELWHAENGIFKPPKHPETDSDPNLRFMTSEIVRLGELIGKLKARIETLEEENQMLTDPDFDEWLKEKANK